MLIDGDACADAGFCTVIETTNASAADVPLATVITNVPVLCVQEPVDSAPLPSKKTLELRPPRAKPVAASAVWVEVSP
eukprot:3938820-Rhodomonas_salina.1